MFILTKPKTFDCQRCGAKGQVLPNYDEWGCLQCGAGHDENGQLLRVQIPDEEVRTYPHKKGQRW